jgi:hypothetical protein
LRRQEPDQLARNTLGSLSLREMSDGGQHNALIRAGE